MGNASIRTLVSVILGVYGLGMIAKELNSIVSCFYFGELVFVLI